MSDQINNNVKQMTAPGFSSVFLAWVSFFIERRGIVALIFCTIFLSLVGFSPNGFAQSVDDFLKQELRDQADNVKKLEKEINQVRPANQEAPVLAPVVKYPEETC